MQQTCFCNCGEFHHYGKYHVEPIEVKWFVDNNHKQKYLDSRGTQFGVDISKADYTNKENPAINGTYMYY